MLRPSPSSVFHVVTLTCFGGAGERGNSLHVLLIHDRTDIPQRGMESLSMVKHFQIRKDRVPSLFPRLIGLTIHTLRLQGADETLHECIIVAICFAAHTHYNTTVSQKCTVVLTGILTATIGMRKSTQAQDGDARAPCVRLVPPVLHRGGYPWPIRPPCGRRCQARPRDRASPAMSTPQ